MVRNFGISMEILWFLRRSQFSGNLTLSFLDQWWSDLSPFKIVDEIQKETFASTLCFLGLVQTPYFSSAEPNWISSTLERHWRDIWFKFDKSSTLSNLTLLPHQTKTAVPNWFRRRSFAVLNSSVRFGTLVERRLNRALGFCIFYIGNSKKWKS